MATSKAPNRNRLVCKLVEAFYCFPNVYYLNENSGDLLVESLAISTTIFPLLVLLTKAIIFHPSCMQTQHFT